MQEIGADQPALLLGESRMRRKGVFHLVGARLEGREQVAVAAWKFSSTSASWLGGHLGIQRQHAVDDMVRAGLVGGIEVARLGRRLEWPHDHPRRIGAQMESLPVQEGDL